MSNSLLAFAKYALFFSDLNSQIYRIREQRIELREEIQDVLALIESSYLEEQRKSAKLQAEAQEAETRKERAKEKRRFRENAR
jgi:hypothetical protein